MIGLSPLKCVERASLRFSLLCILVGLVTSCAPTRNVREEEPVAMEVIPVARGPVVVIDAGHGGKDLGANSKFPHYEEKALALDTAFIVEHYLQKLGYRTVLTRTDDVFIPLKKRSSIANDLNADIFVSVHYNSAPSKQANGIEVFYYNSEKNRPRARKSKELADRVLDRVIGRTNAKSRGVKHGNLSVVRETNMPAVLVEGGFLTNEGERSMILTHSYMEQLAFGIASGVNDYFQSVQASNPIKLTP